MAFARRHIYCHCINTATKQSAQPLFKIPLSKGVLTALAKDMLSLARANKYFFLNGLRQKVYILSLH
jgi:hypothetical protein